MKASLEPWPVQVMARVDSKPGRTSESERSLPEPLAQIYDKHFDFVWRNARRLGVPEASAEDVAQDVFLIVQRRLADFDGRVPIQSWIFGILVRVVRDHRRSYRRKGARHVPLEQEVTRQAGVSPGPTPVEQAERAERVRLLDRLLGELDEHKRALLILWKLEGWTLREIAELYGSNVNTIHSRLTVAQREFEQAYTRSQADRKDPP